MTDDAPSAPPWAERRPDGWLLRVRVQPGARRSRVVGPHGDALKVAVAAPANDGKANAELVRFLADALCTRPAEVVLRSGQRSRTKVLHLPGSCEPLLLQR